MAKQKQTQEQARESRYPLSLEEALFLARRVEWAEWKPQPDNFRIGGFYGKIADATANLLRDRFDLTATVSSKYGIVESKNLVFADYQDTRFNEIYNDLIERDAKALEDSRSDLIRKLKDLAKQTRE